MDLTDGVRKPLSKHMCDGVGFGFRCYKVVLVITVNTRRNTTSRTRYLELAHIFSKLGERPMGFQREIHLGGYQRAT
jgi:hypothetical protein